MKSLLDKDFVYTDAAHTDLKALFRRIRKEQRAKQEAEIAASANVKVIGRKAK